MDSVMIVDNSPNSYQFQPENGIPILSWYDDPNDNELMRMVPALRLLSRVSDVRTVILQSTFNNEFNVDMAVQICETLIIIKQKEQQEKQERLKNEEKIQAKERRKQQSISYREQKSSDSGKALNLKQNDENNSVNTNEHSP